VQSGCGQEFARVQIGCSCSRFFTVQRTKEQRRNKFSSEVAFSLRKCVSKGSSKLLINMLAWILLLCIGAAHGHELCLDNTFPVVHQGSFATCEAYDGLRTCIAPGDEATQVDDVISSIGPDSAACTIRMTEIVCANADGWSAHLFDAEGNGLQRTFPILCDSYCALVYADCENDVITSTVLTGSASATTLAVEYGSPSAFCTAFGESSAPNNLYCFDGNPFVVPTPQEFAPGIEVTVEKVSDFGGLLGMIPFPERTSQFVGFSQDGSAFVMSILQSGEISVEGDFLDISSRLIVNGERGLLGLALHKDFATNGRLFVQYSCDQPADPFCSKDGNNIVAEYSVPNPSVAFPVADPSPVRLIIEIEQDFANHNGGQLLFSPDANDPYLYVILGDGGSGNDPNRRAQDLTSLLGKILRFDIDDTPPYTIPADNPFAGNSNGFREEIWAYGIRNPWRCSFDRQNPSYFFCGDVGQNVIEEVSLIRKGGNFGWPTWEGTRRNPAVGEEISPSGIQIDPIAEYTHEDLGKGGAGSITGGYRYYGDAPGLNGTYIYGDFYGALFVAFESPPLSGQFVNTRASYACVNGQNDLQCPNDPMEYTFAFAEDPVTNELYALTGNGIFRVFSSDSLQVPSSKLRLHNFRPLLIVFVLLFRLC